MILVEEMDRTLKAWVQEYEDVNLEVLPVLEEILGTLDIMLQTSCSALGSEIQPEIGAALGIDPVKIKVVVLDTEPLRIPRAAPKLPGLARQHWRNGSLNGDHDIG